MEKKYVLSVTVDNNFGVLQRICSLFSRRCFNIKSINASETENPKISVMTIVVDCNDNTLIQIKNQLIKLIDVKKIDVLHRNNAVFREHILVIVGDSGQSRTSVANIASLFNAKILDVSEKSLMLELTDTPQTIDNFVKILSEHKIIKMVRTGISALEKN